MKVSLNEIASETELQLKTFYPPIIKVGGLFCAKPDPDTLFRSFFIIFPARLSLSRDGKS